VLYFPIERFIRRFRPTPPPGGFSNTGGTTGTGGAGAAGGGAAAGSGGGGAAAGGAGNTPGGSIYNQAAWLLQPSSFLDIDKFGAVALPAIGAVAPFAWDGTPFKVPSGRHAKITGIGIDFQPNGSVAANAIFQQDVLPYQLAFMLTTDAVGTSFGDFALFHYLPGSVSNPMGIAGLMVKEGQTVTVSVKNISVVVAAQFLGVHLQGYSYPKNLEPKNMGYQ
jgi:hypothetical protein